jgi:hypothetical protein
MPNTTNALQMTILSTEDSSQQVLVNRSATPSMDGDICELVSYSRTPDAVIHQMPFPVGVTTVYQIYIKNLSAAGSLMVTGNPGSTIVNTLALLGPGDVFLYWATTKTAPLIGALGQGYSEIDITGSVAGIFYEYFLGA